MKRILTLKHAFTTIAFIFMAVQLNSQDCSVDNLVNNGGFELGLNGWQVLGAGTSVADPYSGSLAAATPGSSVKFIQEFSASAGEAFAIGAYAKVNGVAMAHVIMEFEDSDDNLLKVVYEEVTSPGYAYYAFSGSAPQNTDHVTITLRKQGNGSAEFDAVCLLSLNVNDPVGPTSTTPCPLLPDTDNYVFSMDVSGTNTAWSDYDIGNLILTKATIDDKDLILTGTILNGRDAEWSAGTGPECSDGDAWEINLNLTNRETWGNSSGEYNGAVFQEAGCEANKIDWYFYDISGSMTGIGCNAGRTITITGNMPGYKLQIGEGGNAHSCDFGLSARLTGTESGSPVDMEIYTHLDEDCFLNSDCSNPPVVTASWSLDFKTVTANSDIHKISNIVMVFDDGSHEKIEYQDSQQDYTVTESGTDDNSGKCIQGVYIKASCNHSAFGDGYGQYVPNPDWDGSCSDLFVGRIVNLCGSERSLEVQSKSLSAGDECIAITDVSNVTRVIAEVWMEKTDCGGILPASINLLADTDTIPARLIDVKRASGTTGDVGIYRNDFPVPVGSVCVSTAGVCTPNGISLYIERMDADAVSSLESDSTELEGSGDCFTGTLFIDGSNRPRDIDFYVPLHGMDSGDGVDITIMGYDINGAAALTETFSFSGINARGASMHHLNIINVNGGITDFDITVCSAASDDRFGVGSLVASCTASCVTDEGLDFYKTVSQDTAVMGDVVTYRFEFEKFWDFELANFTFTDLLEKGMEWVSEPTALTDGVVLGSTSVTGKTIAEFDIVSLPVGLSSFEIQASIPNPYSGPNPYMNQAWLTGLPVNMEDFIASDYPVTPVEDDPTPLVILSEDDCIGSWNIPDITVDFEWNYLSVDVTSTRSLMNVVLKFSDGSTQVFDELDFKTGTFSGTGENEGKCIVGLWVRTACNASGEGPEYGEYRENRYWDGFCITDPPPVVIDVTSNHGSTVLNGNGPTLIGWHGPRGHHRNQNTVPSDNTAAPNATESQDFSGWEKVINPESTEISVYPNPARSNATINVSGLSTTEWTVHIYAMNGKYINAQVVYPNQGIDITSLNLGSGMYFLEFENGIARRSARLVLQE